MYTLTLSRSERRNIDWLSSRYSNGLCEVDWDSDCDWDSDGDIVFSIPEHVLWRIAELHDNEGGWPCFAASLCEKMDDLLMSIV